MILIKAKGIYFGMDSNFKTTFFDRINRIYQDFFIFIFGFLMKPKIHNPLSAEILILSNVARLSSYALMLLSMIWINNLK